jgi:hypothetical protein
MTAPFRRDELTKHPWFARLRAVALPNPVSASYRTRTFSGEKHRFFSLRGG